MYIDHGVDKLAMIKLVKYIIRQFLHIQNLETEHFMEARFHWYTNSHLGPITTRFINIQKCLAKQLHLSLNMMVREN